MPEPKEVLSDSDLISAWKSGDEVAAAELVRRHAGAVARYLSAAGGRDDVDDLVQEAFFRAFRRLESFRGTASFRTWVMTIGSNALKDQRRRESRRPTLELDNHDIVDEAASPHATTVARDLEARLQREVENLPTMQRDVFLLRAQQGAEYEEIAEVLGTSVGAARVHYHQAVKRIKKALS
ncbi:RNA polymerase sigma factor [Gemmatimonadota bacterium]